MLAQPMKVAFLHYQEGIVIQQVLSADYEFRFLLDSLSFWPRMFPFWCKVICSFLLQKEVSQLSVTIHLIPCMKVTNTINNTNNNGSSQRTSSNKDLIIWLRCSKSNFRKLHRVLQSRLLVVDSKHMVFLIQTLRRIQKALMFNIVKRGGLLEMKPKIGWRCRRRVPTLLWLQTLPGHEDM